jgi:flagellar basal-body rod modification protein FlgD
MADINGAVAGLAQNTNGTTSLAPKKKQGEIGKDDFMTMLIAQLKAQDPMDPMKSEEFAVNLAQFTQVEQLTKINDSIAKMSGGDSSNSLASYLGTEVSVGTDAVGVTQGNAGTLNVDLPTALNSLKVQFLDKDGNVKGVKEFTNLPAGKNKLPLNSLGLSNGTYSLKIDGQASGGLTSSIQGKISGIVSGFIPGADPKLILGNREVSPKDIKEVGIPSTTTGA